MSDPETLSLGGGIVKVDAVDMGFCPNFSIQLQITKDLKYKYYETGTSLIKIPVFADSEITQVSVTGQFSCETITNETLLKLGFFSNSTNKLFSLFTTNFNIPSCVVSFVSTPKVGKKITFTCSNAFLEPTNSFDLLNISNWNKIDFSFTGMLDNFNSTPPSLVLTD